MFAVVRTGGKQYRVAPGDKIVVEKLDGNAGDKITLGDVLLAGEGSNLKSTNGLTVAAEIVAQAKGDKVTVFKKRRRHNYRRKQGHRQLHTILKIVAIGDHKEEKKARGENGSQGRRRRPRRRPSWKSQPPRRAAKRLPRLRRYGPRPTLKSISRWRIPVNRPKIRRPTTTRPPAPKSPSRKRQRRPSSGQKPVDKKCCTC